MNRRRTATLAVAALGVVTLVQTAALVVWLAYVLDAPLVGWATAIGLGALLAGLVLEHVLVDATVNGLDRSFPAGAVVLVSATETAIWALWLLVAEWVDGTVGLLAAGAVLAVLLVPQHSVEDAVLRGERLRSNALERGTVGFSAVEAAGATLWLGLVLAAAPFGQLLAGPLGIVDPATLGLGVLAVALLVEHVAGVRYATRA